MSTPQTAPTAALTEEARDDLALRGLAFYDAKLKPFLEPAENRRFVAIHVDTEDYVVTRSSGDAMRAILQRHPPDGRVIIRKIGDEPEYGLMARILAGQLAADIPK